MTYQDLAKLTEGKPFPLCGTNEDGERVIIQHGKAGQPFFKLSTVQHNGWIRTNYVYEDGSTEELYSR